MWVNGQLQDNVAIGDRAVQFGDGCFTTAHISQSEVKALDAHLMRLQLGCERLLIESVDWQRLREEMLNAAVGHSEAVLKVIISRGKGGRGYSASGCGQPTRILTVSDYPGHYYHLKVTGVSLQLSSIRLARNPFLAGIKHLNRLEQVLIRAELEQTDADEALVLDTEGMLVECCAANLFWRKGNDVFTPCLSDSGVNGIQRQQVIKLLRETGTIVSEVRNSPDVLQEADEVLITNALMPVLPVRQISQHFYHDRNLYNFLISRI
ncbi:aminodeoxychorismate lyase [Erwinia tracheiphila]|uniref:Aminodeoxychorismate lyase n=1 Tax=Erwinia tracheiphila TaxID=65700 RepID=A0A0M2K882_9GAMM|nr:aminodeoxychorismate lyase [Erwinia tracheiphila]AXF75453.1 aminodeoxychorismate lyase [Erwinia tracheiphila]EOS93768.1 4-amino-4-deoxychorismate lyase [Erwinia tracheiphila PSU-1]KKF35585.1 4-amino-4-deoxychorismate lyase [Erwinia tracheiphila]UIA82000.1 aminodeoxychorismate lyase [Erwinia tracheiphila]UIA89764.1 aminodeoxychorismate lyase [Erwinia tracheiphila]